VTNAKGEFEFIHPTTEAQILDLGSMEPPDFKIAEDLFYIDFKLRWTYLDPRLPDR